MGKIHDALEKAQKKNKKLEQPSAYFRPNGVVEKQAVEKENVVQLQIKNNSISPQPDYSLVTFHNPHSIESELFKIIRTNILFPEHGKPIKTILVTSASSGEGKTFTATNLSCSIAQGIEEHVLLIDCDLRRSSIHKVFGMSNVKGLSDYLLKRVQVSDIIYRTPIQKLSIIPAGDGVPPNPSELLSSNKMAVFLEEAKNRYADRYIVIDSPPPQITAETKALSRIVDGVILVVNSHKTKKKKIKEIVEEFGKEKIIGVVMNQVDNQIMKNQGYSDLKKYRIGK